jgi:hypothetical protein
MAAAQWLISCSSRLANPGTSTTRSQVSSICTTRNTAIGFTEFGLKRTSIAPDRRRRRATPPLSSAATLAPAGSCRTRPDPSIIFLMRPYLTSAAHALGSVPAASARRSRGDCAGSSPLTGNFLARFAGGRNGCNPRVPLAFLPPCRSPTVSPPSQDLPCVMGDPLAGHMILAIEDRIDRFVHNLERTRA